MDGQKKIKAALAAVMFCLSFAFVAAAYEAAPAANVTIGSHSIYLQPTVSYSKAIIAISCPNGQVLYKNFEGGSSLYMDLSEMGTPYDGLYSYELRLMPIVDKKARIAGIPSIKPMLQSGHFTVRGGSIMSMSNPEPNLARTQDVLHYDDVIVTGSLCVGFDCIDGESFGYCTIKLKENNLQICFEDTSTSTFPTNDWKIQTNDSTSGGASYFTIWDTDGGVRPFTIEAGAPAHSLYVLDTLKNLSPVKYTYKVDKSEQYIGFIAEDVPELVAMNDRTGLSPMDIVGVLTKVVQEQQDTIEELKKQISEIKK